MRSPLSGCTNVKDHAWRTPCLQWTTTQGEKRWACSLHIRLRVIHQEDQEAKMRFWLQIDIISQASYQLAKPRNIWRQLKSHITGGHNFVPLPNYYYTYASLDSLEITCQKAIPNRNKLVFQPLLGRISYGIILSYLWGTRGRKRRCNPKNCWFCNKLFLFPGDFQIARLVSTGFCTSFNPTSSWNMPRLRASDRTKAGRSVFLETKAQRLAKGRYNSSGRAKVGERRITCVCVYEYTTSNIYIYIYILWKVCL